MSNIDKKEQLDKCAKGLGSSKLGLEGVLGLYQAGCQVNKGSWPELSVVRMWN